MNAYCVILCRQPFVNPAYPRTKRYYVGAPRLIAPFLPPLTTTRISVSWVWSIATSIHPFRKTTPHPRPPRSGRLLERRPPAGPSASGVPLFHDLYQVTPALTRSGVNGRSRSRAPVASKIAFPIAAGVTVIAVSPAPVAGTPLGVTKTLSIAGIS